MTTPRYVTLPAGPLQVGLLESGPADGPPVILLHGFPYDAHAYDEVARRLAEKGCRVIVPWLRGYGPTRFLDDESPRSGQQAALAHDLLALMDAMGLEKAVLAGYDWGGRAACIVAALWPARVIGLVTAGGYNIQDIAGAMKPQSPANEHRYWYQYYFHSERGVAGLTRYRRDFCRLLWTQWSPRWAFTDADFERSAAAFDNPDFVEVVIHSYRHRYGLVAGDPHFEASERRLAQRPPITVPTRILDGMADGVAPQGLQGDPSRQFHGPCQQHLLPDVGHNVPQEAPAAFAAAVWDLLGGPEPREPIR